MERNVSIVDPKTTFVDGMVKIGSGTTVYPNTTILGKTVIGKNCEIGPNTIIQDSKIGDGCIVFASVVKNSVMEDGSDIGPFSHLRAEVTVGKNVHLGNYVEAVRTIIGDGTKVGHVTYLGDATIGKNVNIGAGTITANYDGEIKSRTVVEDDVFIGSNTVLVAPVKVGQGAKTGAGSVVREDVSEKTLVAGVPAKIKKKL